ncbi:MAG: PQQ-binding-like beta-propeller repeat protein [Verrucomicrobiota bacterium]|nr:PQQ-binding-like beta-propeller repeat protein [Verrucomicrobiota bacterium]
MNRVVILLLAATFVVSADWPQWRGPNRNGLVVGSEPLLNVFQEDGPQQLWKSEPIPSNDSGGHGSVVVAGNRVYMGIVWHSDLPSEKRELNELVLRKLGYRNLDSSPDLVSKMEKARLSLSPRLRGEKLEEWIDKWVEENLGKLQEQRLASWIGSRFKKGRLAMPYAELRRLGKKSGHVFPSDQAFRKWLDDEGFSDLVKEQVIKMVPASVRVAKDAVVCMDAATGKTLWKTEAPGLPTGRRASSTPCVADGKVFAAGSTHAHCLDAITGKQLWSVELPSKGPASSFLVGDGKAFIMAGKLLAIDVKTGKEVWRSGEISASSSSPVLWEASGKQFLIVNTRKNISCVNLVDGSVIWTAPGGGDSTPAINGNWMAVYCRDTKTGLAAYKLSAAGAKQLWKLPLEARRSQSSPVIYQGHVYLTGGENHLCVEISRGKVKWREKRQSTISSPLIVDGKLITLEKKGSELVLLKASPKAHQELAKARVKTMWCPSPVVSNGRLFLRMADHVACFNLAEKMPLP